MNNSDQRRRRKVAEGEEDQVQQQPHIGCMTSLFRVFVDIKRSPTLQTQAKGVMMTTDIPPAPAEAPLKEVPRLSLDSRVVMDAKGNLRPRRHFPSAHHSSSSSSLTPPPPYSPGVVARLMGIDSIPTTTVESRLTRSLSDSKTHRFPLPLVHLRHLHHHHHLNSDHPPSSSPPLKPPKPRKCLHFAMVEAFPSHIYVKIRDMKQLRRDYSKQQQKKKRFSTSQMGSGPHSAVIAIKQKGHPDRVFSEAWRRKNRERRAEGGGRSCILVKGGVQEGRRRRTEEEAEEEEGSPSSSSVSDSSGGGGGLGWPLLQGWRGGEGEGGRRRLLERCEELIQSIEELQPSPVSVLDQGLYKEDGLATRVRKRAIDFREQEQKEEVEAETEEEKKGGGEWGWEEEVGEVVLQLEQLLFKDIVTETIGYACATTGLPQPRSKTESVQH